MKKPFTLVKFLFITGACFLLISCSKKGDQAPGAASLLGKWNITADTSHTFGYPPYIIEGINSPYMQFNADGTGTQKNNIGTPDDVETFTYKISHDTIAFNFPVQPQLPYGNTPTGVIKKLTSKNLIIEYDLISNLVVIERVYMSR